MSHCKFTDSAKRDLEDISDYSLKHWGKQQTIKYLNDIKDKTLALSNNPNIGTLRSNIHPNLLSLPIKKHIIYYLIQKDGIVIIRILHANMCPKFHKFSTYNLG